MSKNTTPLVPLVGSAVIDVMPELDDVQQIQPINPDQPSPEDCWLIEKMASHFLTADEICSIVKITRGQFEGNLEYAASYQRGVNMGKASLRRMQFVAAKRNPVMQIWLGKQHLDQHDKVETKQGDTRKDAYEGFLNKLQIELNVSTTGQTAPVIIGSGKGDSALHLGAVRTDQPDGTDSGGVVGETLDSGDHQELVRRPDERGVDV
jgi:hypothetical protein